MNSARRGVTEGSIFPLWLIGTPRGLARQTAIAMAFSFPELIAHAARTRSLVAGTIIGSGTVSNENFRQIGSSCIAEKRGIEMLDEGTPRTGYMKFGDTVRMEARSTDGASLFGEILQRVIQS